MAPIMGGNVTCQEAATNAGLSGYQYTTGKLTIMVAHSAQALALLTLKLTAPI